MGVGGREPHGQGNAVAVDRQVVFGAQLAAIRGVAAGLLAPLFARTLRESILALLQSTAAAPPNQLRSVSCNRSQTPASCQSRRRRQQVVPLPQPNPFGSNRHGQPVRRTKTMPVRATRAGMRGRPPLGFGRSFGRSGSMASQRSSGTSGWFIVAAHHAITSWVMKHALNAATTPVAELHCPRGPSPCPPPIEVRLGRTPPAGASSLHCRPPRSRHRWQD